MSKLLIAGVFMMLSAAASAGETGIINQAGPYEATMRFYLHPAHGFPGKAETTEQGGLVADANEKARAQLSRESEKRLASDIASFQYRTGSAQPGRRART